MRICGFNKTTLLDYPGKVVSTIFLGGCNFRCPFCQNGILVVAPGEQPDYSQEELLTFLKKRKGILEGVCVTGGEPTLNADLIDFLKKVKAMGYKTKLDTNGTNPDMLIRAVEENAVDYVAMDIKNSREKYGLSVGIKNYDTSKIEKSVSFLLEDRVDYEFRTTVVKEFNDEESFKGIAEWIKGAKKYFLQAFKDSGDLIDESVHGLSRDEMLALLPVFDKKVGKVEIRGMD